MKTIIKNSANSDKAKINEDEFRGNISTAASGVIFPSTTLGLNTIYWVLMGAILGGVVITVIIVGLCKYHGLGAKPSTSTTMAPSGGTIVHNNIQVNPAETKFTLVPFKKKRSNMMSLEEIPVLPETLTQDEL